MSRPKFAAFEDLKKHVTIPTTDGIESFFYPVDGGGRDLVTDVIAAIDQPLMVEIGAFLCGSTIQWLEASSSLRLIAVDPWAEKEPGAVAGTLKKYHQNPVFDPTFKHIKDVDGFIESVRKHGFFLSAVANLRPYRERAVAWRGRSPEALLQLREKWKISPDIVYIDANKEANDLKQAHEIWPDAILCGDDWTWGKHLGYPMQKVVIEFASEHGFEIESRRATWLLKK